MAFGTVGLLVVLALDKESSLIDAALLKCCCRGGMLSFLLLHLFVSSYLQVWSFFSHLAAYDCLEKLYDFFVLALVVLDHGQELTEFYLS